MRKGKFLVDLVDPTKMIADELKQRERSVDSLLFSLLAHDQLNSFICRRRDIRLGHVLRLGKEAEVQCERQNFR